MRPSEVDAGEELRRLKEDNLARNHVGYFKLWSMTRQRGRTGWPEGPWTKGKVIGIFPTREPCEQVLDLVEHGPEVTYEFVRFDHGIDHIEGSWAVELNDDGSVRTQSWRWHGSSSSNCFCHGENRWAGYGRTLDEAIAVARAYKEECERFIREERPDRAQGCYCQPNSQSPCGPCERAEKDRKKKECGCPHCEGDH